MVVLHRYGCREFACADRLVGRPGQTVGRATCHTVYLLACKRHIFCDGQVVLAVCVVIAMAEHLLLAYQDHQVSHITFKPTILLNMAFNKQKCILLRYLKYELKTFFPKLNSL